MQDEAGRSPDPLPAVVSATELSNSFLGGLVEVCLVTADHRRTMEGLVRLGIGPWRIYTFDSRTVGERTYRGEPADFGIRVCFADAGGTAMEIMEPLFGPSILQSTSTATARGSTTWRSTSTSVPGRTASPTSRSAGSR